MTHSFFSMVRITTALFVGVLMIGSMCGCKDRAATETSMFEAAEVNYRQGDYSNALTGYQEFLLRYPSSPLAKTAEMRVRNIRREVSSLMDQPGAPRPVYHGSRPNQSEATPETTQNPILPSKPTNYPPYFPF